MQKQKYTNGICESYTFNGTFEHKRKLDSTTSGRQFPIYEMT